MQRNPEMKKTGINSFFSSSETLFSNPIQG
jgi:hypothetical protein